MGVSSGSLVGQMCGKGFLDDVRRFVCLFLFSACESDFTLHKPGAHTSTAWRWHASFCNGLATSHILILSNFISPFRASLRIGSQRDVTAIAFEDFILPFIRPVFGPFFLSSTPQSAVPPSIVIVRDLTHFRLTRSAGHKRLTFLASRAAFKIGAANYRFCLMLLDNGSNVPQQPISNNPL